MKNYALIEARSKMVSLYGQVIGITQNEAVERIYGISQSHLSELENGKREPTGKERLVITEFYVSHGAHDPSVELFPDSFYEDRVTENQDEIVAYREGLFTHVEADIPFDENDYAVQAHEYELPAEGRIDLLKHVVKAILPSNKQYAVAILRPGLDGESMTFSEIGEELSTNEHTMSYHAAHGFMNRAAENLQKNKFLTNFLYENV